MSFAMKTLLALSLLSMPLFHAPRLDSSRPGVTADKGKGKGGHKDGGGDKKKEEDEEDVTGELPELPTA